MADLSAQKILLGVSGGIAAYKSAELVRRLRASGAQVRVVMTAAATRFITPLTLQALSGEPVLSEWLDAEAEARMPHIELARWADCILIAPATADVLARLAHGLADDLLTTVCLASRAPLVLAPAMNQQMWQHPATQANLALLRDRGARILGPADGAQACGEVGPGRMLEPIQLVEALPPTAAPLAGLHVVISAGPTREALDPVRYLSNRSSGKMGYALAAAAVAAGARVTLISGPVCLEAPPGVTRVWVEDARQMQAAVLAAVAQAQIYIGAAAVGDFRPAQVGVQKQKKTGTDWVLTLTPNPDILAEVAALSPPQRPFCVGFAAETEQLAHYARSKLIAKRVDMMIANQVAGAVGGFESDLNQVQVFWPTGDQALPLLPKRALATRLLELIYVHYKECHADTA